MAIRFDRFDDWETKDCPEPSAFNDDAACYVFVERTRWPEMSRNIDDIFCTRPKNHDGPHMMHTTWNSTKNTHAIVHTIWREYATWEID